MVDISVPITRTKKTDIAGSVVVTPSASPTGTSASPADLVNGFAPIAVNFPAGVVTQPAVFAIVDDALVEGTEKLRLTMSNPQPSGTFTSGAFIDVDILDNDVAAGGPTVIYGPTTAVNTGAWNIGASGGQLDTTLIDALWSIKIGDQDGTPSYAIEHGGVNGKVGGRNIGADSSSAVDANFNYSTSPNFPAAARIVFSPTQIIIFIGDMTTAYKTLNRSANAAGTYVQYSTGGAAVSSTITKAA